MRPAIATDHDLIEQLKKHDEHAVTELVVTYKPKVYQLAFPIPAQQGRRGGGVAGRSDEGHQQDRGVPR
jgi:hypothetical protein